MDEFFFTALSFGVAAGLNPSPLSIIVIQQTLSKGLIGGFRTSLAPLITDGPIILATLWLLSHFKNISWFVASLSLLGGIYLIWVAIKMIFINTSILTKRLAEKGSFIQAIKIHFLNPNPYLFWFTIGGSYILRGNTLQSAIFIGTAIFTIIASKFALALLVSFFKMDINSRGYLFIMKILAMIMAVFGSLSIYQAYIFVEKMGVDLSIFGEWVTFFNILTRKAQ